MTDYVGCCFYAFDKDGNCVRKIGRKGPYVGQFHYPEGVSYLNDNEVLIADEFNHRTQQVDIQTGTVIKSFRKYGTAN